MSQDDSSREATKILAVEIYKLRASGMSTLDIARQLKISRRTVSRALGSPTGKQMLKHARDRLEALIEDAIDVYEESLRNNKEDMTNAQKAAKDVLKNFGLLRDSIDMNHHFPKPTVVKRLSDGTEVVLGAGTTTKDDDGEET